MKRLSYIEDARCLKVNVPLHLHFPSCNKITGRIHEFGRSVSVPGTGRGAPKAVPAKENVETVMGPFQRSPRCSDREKSRSPGIPKRSLGRKSHDMKYHP